MRSGYGKKGATEKEENCGCNFMNSVCIVEGCSSA